MKSVVYVRRRILVASVLATLFLLALLWKQDRSGEEEIVETQTENNRNISEEKRSRRGGDSRVFAVEETFGVSIAQLLLGEDESVRERFKLRPEEIEDFLERNRTNAMSLVVAFEATHDRGFLKKAAEAFPNDRIVQAKVLFYDLEPEKRAEWMERLKQTAPNNSVPHLLAARDHINAGDDVSALREIVAAREKRFEDYTREAWAGLEEAYLLAGRTPAAAKAMASAEILVPYLTPVKRLASELADRAAEHGKAGDPAAQAALLQGAWIIGTQVRESGNRGVLLNDVVGLAIQNRSLQDWPEGVSAPFLDRSPQEQMAANDQLKKEVKAGTDFFRTWLPQAPESEIMAYLNRLRLQGERNAMRWLRQRHEMTSE